MFRRASLWLSTSGVSSPAPPLHMTTPTQVIFLEIWEHFKRFGLADSGDAVSVRIQAPPDAVTLINNTVMMRNHLELFLVAPQGPMNQHPEKGWQVGSFRNSRNASRRLIVETLLTHGWSLEQQNCSISERDMIITSMTFVKKSLQASSSP